MNQNFFVLLTVLVLIVVMSPHVTGPSCFASLSVEPALCALWSMPFGSRRLHGPRSVLSAISGVRAIAAHWGSERSRGGALDDGAVFGEA